MQEKPQLVLLVSTEGCVCVCVCSPLSLFGVMLEQVDQAAEINVQAEDVWDSVSSRAAKTDQIQAVECGQYFWIVTFLELQAIQLGDSLQGVQGLH